jgi:PPM family protein phosphatase
MDRQSVGARTHVGRVRETNEDAFLAEAPLFAVADGMGGHLAGQVASGIAIDAFRQERIRGTHVGRALLIVAMETANDRIQAAATTADRAGMGTTCVCAWIDPTTVTIAHAGDSRAYLVRAGELRRLTTDHSVVGALVREGMLNAEQASQDARRNIITKALGAERQVSPDVSTVELAVGDRLILCSDGLTEAVSEAAMRDIATADVDADTAAANLLAAALEGGGPDNVTVIVVDPMVVRAPDADAHRGLRERLGFRR